MDDSARYWSQRSAIRSAAEDRSAKDTRRRLCSALGSAFETAGEALQTIGHIFGPDRVDESSPFGNGDDSLVALGQLSSTAASLIRGAVQLLDEQNTYAASALNRQLVEVEYLSWAFAEDRDEASSWLRSNRQERLARWQPRHLRDRSHGRFRGADYAEHCEIGGHPSPLGIRALITARKAATIELTFCEAALHGSSTWDYLLSAVEAYWCDQNQAELPIPDSLVKEVATAVGAWHSDDHLIPTWNTVRGS